MSRLTIRRGAEESGVSFTGTPLLSEVLLQAHAAPAQPCGGRGVCGKCAVLRLEGAVSSPNEAEQRAGVRLSCQARLLGDAVVWLPEDVQFRHIELDGSERPLSLHPLPGRWGAAVDIGTTTLALKLYDLQTGACVGQASALNPQTSVAADVMGRISAALDGRLELLRDQIGSAIDTLLAQACAGVCAPGDVGPLVLTGNTTMLYLLTGRSPDSLATAPFAADHLFGETVQQEGHTWVLPPCMNAFVGADITCALLSSGLCEKDETALLCDIGTNGEIALWKDGQLFVTSTAAGPAFEGAGISCGCGSIAGAIDRVTLENGRICPHTIGEVPAVGLCGSGLIDAVAAFLQTGDIDETGAMEEDELELRDGVCLAQKDIRAVQLAKAAIAAGIETLMECAGVRPADIGTLYIAGGFGSHLNVHSAALIGLLPALLVGRVRVIGNAALSGAARLLLSQDEEAAAQDIARRAQHVNLGGNPRFNERYVEHMLFPFEED